MKILATLKTVDEIENLSSLCDGIVITNEYVSARYETSFNFEQIKEILKIAHSYKLETYINANAIFDDQTLDECYKLINEFKDTQLMYIFSDLAVYEILSDLEIVRKGVYNPNTLITNYYDFLFFKDYKIKGLFPSLEIPVDDILVIGKNKKRKLYYTGFGYQVMFQSKRHLLECYKEETGKEVNIDSKNMYLKEETREDTYKIIENRHGTHIYQTGIHNILPALDNIADSVDYLFLDGTFIESNKYYEALRIYNDAILDLDYLNKYNKRLEKVFDNLTYDFLYEDSVFKKGDF